jgi:hypothetical protein
MFAGIRRPRLNRNQNCLSLMYIYLCSDFFVGIYV